jgi:hypothetical protein
MTDKLDNLAPRFCPRCGGLMLKPQRSTLYWHAERNHPRCDITNLPDPLFQSRNETPAIVPPVVPLAGARKSAKSSL